MDSPGASKTCQENSHNPHKDLISRTKWERLRIGHLGARNIEQPQCGEVKVQCCNCKHVVIGDLLRVFMVFARIANYTSSSRLPSRGGSLHIVSPSPPSASSCPSYEFGVSHRMLPRLLQHGARKSLGSATGCYPGCCSMEPKTTL